MCVCVCACEYACEYVCEHVRVCVYTMCVCVHVCVLIKLPGLKSERNHIVIRSCTGIHILADVRLSSS